MNAIRYTIGVAMLGTSVATWASHTSCTFSGEKADKYYEIEFIGQLTEGPQIVFASAAHNSGQRQVLNAKNYTLTNGAVINTFTLVFKNQGNVSQPPSFSLRSDKGNSELTFGAEVIKGELSCQ